MVKILQPTPKTCPSFLYSMAGEATELANPVMGTSAPAPPNLTMGAYRPKPVKRTLRKTRIKEQKLPEVSLSIPRVFDAKFKRN